MILILNNKDSFVWNLASYASMYDEVEVLDNTASPQAAGAINPDGIIISPGPGAPDKRRYVGNIPEIIASSSCPVLGVCLGHQIIAHSHGGIVDRIEPRHGKSSMVMHDGLGIFKGIRNPLCAGRYHSLAIKRMPIGFYVSARSEDGTIMAIRSDDGRFEGLQFHPESILTEFESGEGLGIIRNFCRLCGVVQ